jgi:membrane fusion protein (multidrug efflux system)
MTDTTFQAATQYDQRRRWLTILGGVVVFALVAYGIYYLAYARYFESTNDAYVGGDVITVTSRESGTVLALRADNTQSVKRGQLLIALDPTTANVAMLSAEADLARTVRKVRSEYAKADEGRAQIEAARVTLAQAQADYSRRAESAKDGAVSREEIQHAADAVTAAKAALASTQSNLGETLASIQGASIANNPEVLSSIANLRNAAIVLGHMKIVAPADGVIAQRTVQIGQQIAPGTPLMAVVPLNSVWIDANFKEAQLQRMRVGQPVTVTADIYGGGVKYHGRVAGLGAGSGSAFALLPPQNASGNWIKIVQRVPVRIALDPNELAQHPLRVGLSVDVTVDVRDDSGSVMANEVQGGPTEGVANDAGGKQLDPLIEKILAENGGGNAGVPQP